MINEPLKEEAVFKAACKIRSSRDRADYLREACQGNELLHQRMISLLRIFDEEKNFLEPPVSAEYQTFDFTLVEPFGTMIGPYKLLEPIGEGGMGTVYLAEQNEPVHRQVALKLIKKGMDTRQVLARFEAEEQALALMDHPNIAKVFDAGATESGRPYFVMELVNGVPIHRFCDEHRLNTKRRLELFIQVCHGMQHAHQKGIIHRDLKPSNILVAMYDDRPVAKVIDFGVAKATGEQLTERSMITRFGQVVGTLEYMSPEQTQFNQSDVDTRSDIYSLGAILYELLTGTPPFEKQRMKKQAFDETLKMIREEEPTKPSTKLHSGADLAPIAKNRRTTTHKLSALVHGDLDWIVIKALEKDRQGRYQSASDFAEDIERYLGSEPIHARPPTLFTRLEKWSRRHAALVWTLLFVSLTLATTFGISTFAISGARDTAVQQREQKEIERQNAVQQQQIAVEQRKAARQNQYYAEMVAGQMHHENGNQGGLYDDLINYLPLSAEQDLRGWEWYYLMSKCRPEERTITDPGLKPFAAWSPDGKYIGTPGAIWEAATGECIRRFSTSNIQRYRVAWSPDGSKFAWANASDENAFYIWDRSTDKVSRFAGHDESVWCLAWSPDGTQIASGSIDKTIKVWDVTLASVLWELSDFPGIVMNIDWSPDNKMLAAGIHHNGTQIWEIATRNKVYERMNDGVCLVAWHPDSNSLAVCESNRWFVLKQSRDKWTIQYEKNISRGHAIDWSRDGSLIAVGHGEKVDVWNSDGASLVARLNGHRQRVNSVSWHRDGRRLVSNDGSQEVKLWNLDHVELQAFDTETEINSIAWHDNATRIVVEHKDGSSTFWDPRNGTLKKHDAIAVKSPVTLSSNRKLAAVYNEDSDSISIHDTSTGATRSLINVDPNRTFHSATFSCDGSSLVVQSEAGHVLHLEVWNVDQEQLLWTWENKRRKTAFGPLKHLSWNADDSCFAAVGLGDVGENGAVYWQDHVHVFDAIQGTRKHKILPQYRQVEFLAWSVDGRWFAIGTADGRVETLDAETGRRVFSQKIHGEGITALAWHPTGHRVAAATRDGKVKIISGKEGKALLDFSAFDSKVVSLAWSKDGQRLAAASSAGDVHSWDASPAFEFTSGNTRRGELAWAYHDRSRRTSDEPHADCLKEFLHHAPDNLGFWRHRGYAYAELGDFERAHEEYSKAVGTELRLSFNAACSRAYTLLGNDRLDEYHQACEKIVGAFQNSPVPSNRGFVAWLTSLTPNPHVDSATVAGMAQACFAKNGSDSGDYFALILGAALFRQGKHEEASRLLTELAKKMGSDGDWRTEYEVACAKYFLSMSRFSLGQKFQAQRWLGQANKHAETYLERAPGWQRIVVLQTLRKEATEKIGDSTNSGT